MVDDSILLALKNDDLSEVDRLTLENEALRACVQRFAAWRSENMHVARAVEKCREVLSLASKRRRKLKRPDELEQACFFVINHATQAKIKKPIIRVERFSKADWDAWIGDFEDETLIGVGSGSTPVAAVRDLLVKVKIYEARCKRGAERHRGE